MWLSIVQEALISIQRDYPQWIYQVRRFGVMIKAYVGPSDLLRMVICLIRISPRKIQQCLGYPIHSRRSLTPVEIMLYGVVAPDHPWRSPALSAQEESKLKQMTITNGTVVHFDTTMTDMAQRIQKLFAQEAIARGWSMHVLEICLPVCLFSVVVLARLSC